MNRRYGIGFDIGIGSVGYAVISWTNNKDARIEDCGVRLFDSGEVPKTKERKNQERRSYRSVRRLVRRRHHRKERAKNFMQKIGLISNEQIKAWQEKNGNQNVFLTRIKGLSEKLTPEEIADCVIHICNHRGYKEFYEDEGDEKEAGKIKSGLTTFEDKFSSGQYRSVAEMIVKDDAFATKTAFPDYHNHKDNDENDYMLIKREHLQQELKSILKNQQKYYRQLSDQNIDFLCDKIVFAQRDFETGPGTEGDKTRKFMGFLDSLGQCMFYKDKRRAFRSSVIADIYSLVNSLSQLSFVDVSTGEIVLPKEVAEKIIDFALANGGIKEADIKAIVKKAGLEINKSDKLDIPETVKTLKVIKSVLDECGYSYSELISEEQFDLDNPSSIAKLCDIMNTNITPHRRSNALRKAGWNDKLCKAMLRKKFGGTASVCEEYMLDAINAFLNGETYGNFQARRLLKRDKEESMGEKHTIIPPFTKEEDADIVENAVVFKAINETRKVLNALIRKYGSPAYINIEVADELGHSVEERSRMTRAMNDNKKAKDKVSQKLIELGLRKEGEVRPGDILRYNLWQQQGGLDLYSGELIAENEILSAKYDIDHIVPFSLILDDTINNKALVNMGANRMEKGQKCPREYLTGTKLDVFLKNVNMLFKGKKINEKKYKYLMLPNLQDTDLLDEWKSRNINDTRYITKYIVNYLSKNLAFDSDKAKCVFAVKGAITSRMRRRWLDDPWGSEEKSRDNHLHHAADAIVIANLTPAYIELASDNIKLQSIFYKNHKRVNAEYTEYLAKAVRKMNKYYGFDSDYANEILQNKKRIPAMVHALNLEVNKRLVDNTLKEFEVVTPESFAAGVMDYYRDDREFASGIAMPLVSYKQNKKFKGALTADNPIKKKDCSSSSAVKLDTLGNENMLDARKYYCLELYKNVKGELRVRGIRFVDLKKQDKKLYLVVDYPEDYREHIMYLFMCDYVRIFNKKGELKFEGYYRSVHSINRVDLYFNHNNTSEHVSKTIAKKDVVKKFAVDILGKVGGEIKCSEPFMLLKAKK